MDGNNNNNFDFYPVHQNINAMTQTTLFTFDDKQFIHINTRTYSYKIFYLKFFILIFT